MIAVAVRRSSSNPVSSNERAGAGCRGAAVGEPVARGLFAAGPAGEAHPAHDNLDKVYTDHEPSRVSVGAPPRRTAQSAEVEAQG